MTGDDQLLYELDDWADDERATLGEALVEAGLAHAWNGATLVVARRDEAAVERVLDAVDEALDERLDPSAPQVAYDLTEWTEDRRSGLDTALDVAGIPHEWSGDELYVLEGDEQLVDGLLDEATNAVAGDGGELGDESGAEMLGELFVAADRLLHDPRDHEGTLSLVDVMRMAKVTGPPFGLDDREWATIIGCAQQLSTLIEHPNLDDDAVIEAATNLRQMLRPLV